MALGACQTVPRDAQSVDGRIAVNVDASAQAPARSMSAPFTLAGDARRGSLALSTPVGTMLAQARWQPGSATLETPEGQRLFSSLDDMAQDLLGERLPLAALMSWLRGQPWPEAPHAPLGRGFVQLGWTIDLSRHPEGFVTALRATPEPKVTVRARLEP